MICSRAHGQFETGTVDKRGVVHDAPSTRTWRQGDPVGANTPKGTLVAQGWIDGKYPSAPPSAYQAGGKYEGKTINHTGVFQGMDKNGNPIIFDQSTGNPLNTRTYTKKDWSVVTSDQKYDKQTSEAAVRPIVVKKPDQNQ